MMELSPVTSTAPCWPLVLLLTVKVSPSVSESLANTLISTELPSWISQDDKIASPSSSEGICAYLSKEVLNRDILSGAVNPSDLIQVFIVDADISPLGNGTLITRTLAAKGPGFSAMPKLSQLPCPPHCGGDYIGRNF